MHSFLNMSAMKLVFFWRNEESTEKENQLNSSNPLPCDGPTVTIRLHFKAIITYTQPFLSIKRSKNNHLKKLELFYTGIIIDLKENYY